MLKIFALAFYMIIKWAKGRGLEITTIFKFLNFTAAFTQSKAHLSDGIDREYTFQIQTSNSLSISAQGFLHMNTDSRANLNILMLLALNNRISYEWLFQNLRTKYISKSFEWKLMNMNTQLSLILLIQHFKVNISLKSC